MADQYEGAGMFSRVVKDKGPGDSLFAQAADDYDPPAKRHRLDSEHATALHADLRGHYHRELDKQADWRKEMERDERIYDNDHWDAEDAAILEERGQVPLVFNVTATAVNWVLGSQRRSPLDYKILPRRKEGLKHAEHKSQLMKYLSDVNDSPYFVNLAFGETVKAGLGWLECGVQSEDDGEPIYDRMESWRSIVYDSSAREPDLSDARYMMRTRWTDVDRACAMFPERDWVIQQSAETIYDTGTMGDLVSGDSAMDSHEMANQNAFFLGGNISHMNRERVRLYEAWFKKPVKAAWIKGGEFSGELFDPKSPGHLNALMNPRVEVVSKVKERMFVAIFTERGLLWLSRSPYRHNGFPFTPIWGYRRASDGAPYGMIRAVRDIQIDLNKRAAKALWHLSAKRVQYEEGSIEDVEKYREEAARPDAMLEYKQGRPPPKIDTDLQHASAQMEYMGRDIVMIQQTSGVTDENLGRETNAASGKAINARQDQGELATNIFFENLRYARKKHGEKMLTLIEQYMTQEKQFRVTNKRGNPEYIDLNVEGDDDSIITRTKADFVITEIDYRATHRQQNVQALIEFASVAAQANPAFIMQMFDLLVESMDIPNQDEIVKRVRQMTGMTDPDEDPNNPSPDTIAIMQAKKAQQDMQQRNAEAEIAGKEAKARAEAAKAAKTEAEVGAMTGQQEREALQKFGEAIRIAVEMAGLPAVAAAADQLMQVAKAEAARTAPLAQPMPPVQPPAAPPAMIPQGA